MNFVKKNSESYFGAFIHFLNNKIEPNTAKKRNEE